MSQLKVAEKLKIAVAGSSGRMGKMLIDAINASDDCELAGQLDIGIDIHAELQNADYLIDFTRPEGTMAHIAVCKELNVKMVIGTTGFSDAEKADIAAASKDIAIMMAPNMSVGVNVTLKLLEMAAKAMNTGYDIEIIEAHHRHKVDAPSGTALKMGEVIRFEHTPRSWDFPSRWPMKSCRASGACARCKRLWRACAKGRKPC